MSWKDNEIVFGMAIEWSCVWEGKNVVYSNMNYTSGAEDARRAILLKGPTQTRSHVSRFGM